MLSTSCHACDQVWFCRIINEQSFRQKSGISGSCCMQGAAEGSYLAKAVVCMWLLNSAVPVGMVVFCYKLTPALEHLI